LIFILAFFSFNLNNFNFIFWILIVSHFEISFVQDLFTRWAKNMVQVHLRSWTILFIW
jgi:hypothetical protein